MERITRSHTGLLVRRIALLYGILMLCRIVFLLYNRPMIGPIAGGEWGALLRGALQFDTVSILYANAPFLLLSLLPFEFRTRRWYREGLFWLYTIVNSLLLVAVNLSDAVYFRYTQKRFTADEIFFADNSNSLQLIGKFLTENLPLVVAGIALIAFLAWGYGRRIVPQSPLREGWVRRMGECAILILAVLLSIAGVRGGVTRMTRPITLSNATLYASSAEKAHFILSNPFCILRTAGNGSSVRYTRYYTPEELLHHFTPAHRPDTTMPPDSLACPNLAGRNVVIFILESFSAEHSAWLCPELHGEGAGYTPFLDSLMERSLVPARTYANGTRSIQAMPAILGSIPSFKTPFVLMPQALGKSRQLPQILQDQGYHTAFLCGSERGSMGFGAYARSAGVKQLISREEYEAAHGKGDFDGYWGVWDGPFLQFAGEEFGRMPEPFCATLFTLSSHHPFVVPDELRNELPQGTTAIHPCVAYDDRSFREFYHRFKQEPWFRRTIFVFVADHVSSEKMASATREFPGNHRIFCFYHTPDGALPAARIEQTAQQIDVMPTLLGLLGNREPYFAFGRDLLREPERPTWAVMYDQTFRAVTDTLWIAFDEQRITAVETTDGIPCPTSDGEPIAAQLKGLIQQYYTHIEAQNYTMDDDGVPSDTDRR